MGRYRAAETREVRERLVRQGRGQGQGATYQPWIRLGEFPNRGNSFRVQSPLTGRTHHYLPNLEYRHHLLCEYLGNVIDIREQYPIHPITETLALAHELRFAPPEFGGHICSVTTDSLLTVDDGTTRRQLARSLKYTSDLPAYPNGGGAGKVRASVEGRKRGRPRKVLTAGHDPGAVGINVTPDDLKFIALSVKVFHLRRGMTLKESYDEMVLHHYSTRDLFDGEVRKIPFPANQLIQLPTYRYWAARLMADMSLQREILDDLLWRKRFRGRAGRARDTTIAAVIPAVSCRIMHWHLSRNRCSYRTS